jgi:hypothetical protein
MPDCRHDFVILVCNPRAALLRCTRCEGVAVLLACYEDCGLWHRWHPDPGATPASTLGTAISARTWLMP